MRYLLSTPNTAFSGRVYGIRFQEGRGELGPESCPPGWTVVALARQIRSDFPNIDLAAVDEADPPGPATEGRRRRGRRGAPQPGGGQP